MKKILVVALFLVSIIGFAQKNEMKMAKKAIASNNFTEALAAISKLESMELDDKTKANFLYFKVQALSGSGGLAKAAKTIGVLKAFESKIGKSKYTKLLEPVLTKLIQNLSKKGISDYETKKYGLAKVTLNELYNLNKKDTLYLEYAAHAAYLDKDLDLALERFIALKDLGYTDMGTIFTAKSIANGSVQSFKTEAEMNKPINLKLYEDQKVVVKKSKAAGIIKNIASIYVEKGDSDKAILAIKSAREADPNDANLIISQANIELEMGNSERFSELMKEAIVLQPNNASLYNNIGITSHKAGRIEEAKAAYKKAIELDPTNADTYSNLGLAMLDKDKALVESLNKNLDNYDKYDAIKAERVLLYNKVLPMYNKSLELNPKNKATLNTLIKIYQILDNYEKAKELKADLQKLN
ncbi:MAG: tetratricopeptide repeat protein [Flavobacteriaceae bacterium]